MAARQIRQLVTHDGKFHADEVMATAILRQLHPEAEIIRSRDPALTCAMEGRIVYDVGLTYDPDSGIFDHHQADRPTRDDGTPYSAFGLIWKHFGQDWLASIGTPAEGIEKIHRRFDMGVVLAIDMTDTGARSINEAGFLKSLTLPAMIGDMVPVFDDDDPAATECSFAAAVDMAAMIIRARVDVMASKLRSELLVREAINAAGGAPVLELPRGMPCEHVIRDLRADHILFVAAPRENSWTLSTVRDVPGSYENRKDLPGAWGGLSGAELAELTGVPDAVFCHPALFIAVAETREGIMRMAELAVAHRHPEADLLEVAEVT